jgi:hypothetical protein
MIPDRRSTLRARLLSPGLASCAVGAVLAILAPMGAGTALAQPPRPIGGFIVDVRGSVPFFPTDADVAEPRELPAADLPAWGLGLEVGAHVYVLRSKGFALGLGASTLWARRTQTPETPEGSAADAGPAVTSRLTAFSPQVSFNFGHRMGWSYISGGVGRATLSVSRDDRPEETGEAVKTINYGGGARWFTRDRLAVSLDLRLYAMNPQVPTARTAGHARHTVVVLNAGIAFR